MPGFRHNLSISDEDFEALPPLERDVIERLSREHPGSTSPPRKELRFKMEETPESASKRMDETADTGQGYDVTEFSNLPKPRRLRP
jgi:hypothetical protein